MAPRGSLNHLPLRAFYVSTLCLWHACIHFHLNFHFIFSQFSSSSSAAFSPSDWVTVQEHPTSNSSTPPSWSVLHLVLCWCGPRRFPISTHPSLAPFWNTPTLPSVLGASHEDPEPKEERSWAPDNGLIVLVTFNLCMVLALSLSPSHFTTCASFARVRKLLLPLINSSFFSLTVFWCCPPHVLLAHHPIFHDFLSFT